MDHAVPQLLAQRIFGLALGYEDLNDHDQLRRDPLLATACDKQDPLGRDRFNPRHRGLALAGPATLNRLELSNNRTTRGLKLPHDPVKIQACLLNQGVRCLPKYARELVIDLDAMGHLVHGGQEGRHYSAYYGDYCYLPLYAFVGEIPLWAQLRTSDQDAATGAVAALEQIVAAIRRRCRRARIIVRGDSGFCREDLLAWCEAAGVSFCLGLARNSVLLELLGRTQADARARHGLTGAVTRQFTEFAYQTQRTWSRARRVIGKAEQSVLGDNPRFVVTNLPAQGFKGERDRGRFQPARLYEEVYCALSPALDGVERHQWLRPPPHRASPAEPLAPWRAERVQNFETIHFLAPVLVFADTIAVLSFAITPPREIICCSAPKPPVSSQGMKYAG